MFGLIKKSAKWIKTWGTLPIYQWIKAAELYRQRDFVAAKEFYELGLKKCPQHPARFCALLDLSFCYYKLGDYKTAEQLLRKVIAAVPDSREASIRLAKLLTWVGDDLEAVRVLKRALTYNENGTDLIAELAFALARNEGPILLISELNKTIQALPLEVLKNNLRLEVARAVLEINSDNYHQGRLALISLAGKIEAPLEAHYFFGCELLKEGKIINARVHFRNALALAPENPQILGRLAETYIVPSELGNMEYANQLALKAAQNSGWLSPREMFILSTSYFEIGEKSTALLIASKAKDVSNQRIGLNADIKKINTLIQDLSAGTIS